MKIGLRTIKTAITASLGIWIATILGFKYASTAGVVAILSVTNTKRSSVKIGVGRILAFMLATIMAFFWYHVVGYNPLAYCLLLLFYIPIAGKWKMPEIVPINSVLMTHFLNEKSMAPWLILNAFGLLLIGITLALIANLHMPSVKEDIENNKQVVDQTIQKLLQQFSELLYRKDVSNECNALLEGLSKSIKQGKQLSKRHMDNQLLSQDEYYLSYFNMRLRQFETLEDMNSLIKQISVDKDVSESVEQLLLNISETYDENNDGLALKENVLEVFQMYETKPLPKTRTEFENRAKLYQLLLQIQTFIDIKVNFSQMNEKML
ncbi:aromatic acid exporter family protein [Vagococcus sp. JNUCC 83]